MSADRSPGDDKITIPDELFERHGLVDTDEADGEDQDEGEEDSLSGDDEDTLEGDDEAPDGEGDTEDSDDDDLEEDEEEEGEEDEDDSDEEASEETDSFFDRKSIDQIKDPEARKVAQAAYRSMQRDYLKKTEEIAGLRKQANEYVQEYESFVSDLETDRGMEHFITTVIRERPEVVTLDVMVDAALANPELFDKVVAKVQRLADDEDALDTHKEKRDLRIQKTQLQQRAEREQRAVRAQRAEQVRNLVTAEAADLGIRSPQSLEIIEGQVALLIRRNHEAERKTTKQEVVQVVQRVARQLQRERRDGGKEEGRKRVKEQQDRTKKLAKKARSPQPPRGGGTRIRKPLEVPADVPDNEAIGEAARRFLGLK